MAAITGASTSSDKQKQQGKNQLMRKMLRRCSSGLAGRSSSREREDDDDDDAGENGPPEDVPRGHFAVYVGAYRSRYVVPVACLAAPEFQELLREAEEEFGFGHRMGGITLPCDEATFHAVLAAAASVVFR